MNYKEARQYIEATKKYGSILGLTTIETLLARLGNPQNQLRFIHIAGTNGKGSVSAFLSAVLKAAGYCVGTYNSPIVFHARELALVNEKKISEADYADMMSRVALAADAMEAEGLPHPTSFEIETAMAFLYFLQKQCQIVVLEAGLGGLEDATNIIQTTELAVITSVSLDHMAILGNTIEEIMEQKAGIIKPGCAAVIQGGIGSSALDCVCRKCKTMQVPLTMADRADERDVVHTFPHQTFSYKKYENLEISMAGAYQPENAMLAVEVIEQLNQRGYSINERQLRKGLKAAILPGRFSVISENPLFIIDGAHNEGAAARLKETIELYFTNRRIIYIMGVLKDKDYEKICEMTLSLAADVITVSTVGERGLHALDLAKCARQYHDRVTAADSLDEAIEISLLLAGNTGLTDVSGTLDLSGDANTITAQGDMREPVIVAFGSLSYLGKVVQIIKKHDNLLNKL